jgi:hypothetical protein
MKTRVHSHEKAPVIPYMGTNSEAVKGKNSNKTTILNGVKIDLISR